MDLREPFNSISHMVGGALGVAGLAVLLDVADGPRETAAAVTYGVALVATFAFSALFHGAHQHGHDASRWWLRKLDHVAVYTLIAGSYTPLLLVKVGGALGEALFAAVWALALGCIALKLAYPIGDGRWFVGSCIGLGWIAILAAPALLPLLSATEMALLLAAGVAYTVGATFYAKDAPRVIGRLSGHELWHLFVLAGSAAHFVFVAAYVF